jgi:predicted RNA binding protein YcfA (HicA-like mRNA interferase family)
MGKLPLLTPREVEANLKALGFVFKTQRGSHKQYERAATASCIRAVVTVDVGHSRFSKDLMKRMIRQSLLTQKEFCSGVLNKPAPASKPVPEGGKNA